MPCSTSMTAVAPAAVAGVAEVDMVAGVDAVALGSALGDLEEPGSWPALLAALAGAQRPVAASNP